ncbi:MAG: dienelactone hydrolase family protein [Candidatus Protistobacter heckmanni]|nr:dienelactone hydrolase family protein [Candidatus Protistobacter heckmanni]
MSTVVPEVDSLAPATGLSQGGRREFVRTALGSALAAAVLPASAQTIKTDFTSLIAGEQTVPAGDIQMPVYVARPEKAVGKLPVVLVISEIFGVHEHIADVARRFAKQGYLAIAPELFIRQGDPSAYGTIAELLEKVVNKVPDPQVLKDLDATVAWAVANGGDTSRLGITGFCWGGRQTWLYTAQNKAVKAGVAWYGRLVGKNDALTSVNPIDVAGKLNAPVLGLYGGQDTGIPLDTVEKMKAALAAAGNPASKASQFVVYPNAQHAFNADYRPSYDEASAKDGWTKCLAWFKDHGVK